MSILFLLISLVFHICSQRMSYFHTFEMDEEFRFPLSSLLLTFFLFNSASYLHLEFYLYVNETRYIIPGCNSLWALGLGVATKPFCLVFLWRFKYNMAKTAYSQPPTLTDSPLFHKRHRQTVFHYKNFLLSFTSKENVHLLSPNLPKSYWLWLI